jgi:hypothetical protein
VLRGYEILPARLGPADQDEQLATEPGLRA